MNPVLERLHANLFTQPYASDGKVNGVFSFARRVPLSVALKKPNIQINGPRRISYLAFDIDREWGGLAWEDANLPPPNMVVINPENGHAHLIYELQEPVWLPRKNDPRPGEPQPVRYLKAAQKAMGRALRADPYYNGLLVKNPLHASWRVLYPCLTPYGLADLCRHLELTQTHASVLVNYEGRNCTLFDSIRHWSYRAKHEFTSFEEFRDSLSNELDRLNGEIPCPLGWTEIRGIAKSVSHWTWNNYTGNGRGKRRGIMGLDPSDPIEQRQQEGQRYTCAKRVEKTLSKIKRAYESLAGFVNRVTKRAVAVRAGLHPNTVAKYWHSLSSIAPKPNRCDSPKPNTIPVQSLPPSLPITLRGTVSLRDKPLSEGAPPRQGDTLIPTQLCTPVMTYTEARHHYGGDIIGVIKYAASMAKKGILIDGLPDKFKPAFQPTIDMFYEHQPTTQ